MVRRFLLLLVSCWVEVRGSTWAAVSSSFLKAVESLAFFVFNCGFKYQFPRLQEKPYLPSWYSGFASSVANKL